MSRSLARHASPATAARSASDLLGRSLAVVTLAFVTLVATVGCGPAGFTFHPVSGKLTVGGKVPANVQISLYPVGGKGPIASGAVDASTGQFQLTSSGGANKPSGKGAVAGKYKVVLNASSGGGAAGGMSPEEAMKQYQGIGQGKAPAAPKASFPKEFGSASTSPKEVEIKAGPNSLDLAL